MQERFLKSGKIPEHYHQWRVPEKLQAQANSRANKTKQLQRITTPPNVASPASHLSLCSVFLLKRQQKNKKKCKKKPLNFTTIFFHLRGKFYKTQFIGRSCRRYPPISRATLYAVLMCSVVPFLSPSSGGACVGLSLHTLAQHTHGRAVKNVIKHSKIVIKVLKNVGKTTKE